MIGRRERNAALAVTLYLLVLLLSAGCSGEPDTGPVKIRWDRETCARCAMAVSDPHYAAEIRGGPAGQKTRVYKFDDIGCAVVWLDQQPWKDDPRTEIWVTDFRDGKWLDATRAWYVTGKKTPMDYGLGAQDAPVEGALNFDQARKHIYRIDEQLYRAPGSHEHAPSPTPAGNNEP